MNTAVSQQQIADQAPQAGSGHAVASVPEKEIDMKDTRPRTPGDTFYDVVQFMTGKLFILGMTAVLAFTAHDRFGPDKIGPIPNGLKWLQKKTNKLVEPLQKIGAEESRTRDVGILVGEGVKATVILSWGGNFFAPLIKWMENSRSEITNWYNKKFGTPEDVQITKEKYANVPKQNWWDVLKGRATAYGVVFGAISGGYLLFGRSKHFAQNKDHRFKLQTYEEFIGRKFSWLHSGSRDISKLPVEKALTTAQEKSKMYRFGKILAIDLFATSTAIVVWNTVSRLSAKKRVAAEEAKKNGHHPPQDTGAAEAPPEIQAKQFTDTVQPRQNHLENPAQPQSYTDLVSQRANEDKAPALSS